MIWHVLSLEMCTYTDKSIPIGQLNSNKHYIILYTYSMNGLLCNIIINAYIRFFVFFHFFPYIHIKSDNEHCLYDLSLAMPDNGQNSKDKRKLILATSLCFAFMVSLMDGLYFWNTAADFIRAHHENGQSFTDREKWFKINFDNAKEI